MLVIFQKPVGADLCCLPSEAFLSEGFAEPETSVELPEGVTPDKELSQTFQALNGCGFPVPSPRLALRVPNGAVLKRLLPRPESLGTWDL